MVVDVVVAVFAPESWLEPLEALCFTNLGANGFWPENGRARCTLAVINTTAHGERSPYE